MCVINVLTHTELLRNKIELKLRVMIFKAGAGRTRKFGYKPLDEGKRLTTN